MSKRPTISVVIPVFNESNYIESVLKAIQAQTLKPDEVIVVDNNSTDDTVEKAKNFSVKIVTEKRQGNVFGRNRGFEEASGDIMFKLDGDSKPRPSWLEFMVNKLEESNVDAASNHISFYDGSLRRLTAIFSNLFVFRLNKLFIGSPALFGSAYCIRRSAWKKVASKLHSDRSIWEDMDLSIALHDGGLPVQTYSEQLVEISMRSGNANTRKLFGNLLEWPRTYWRNNKRIAALVVMFLVLVVFPLVLTYRLFTLWNFKAKRGQYHH